MAAENKKFEITSRSEVRDVIRNTWCSLKPDGELLTPRVGHTAIYLHKEQKVVFIGGATPGSLYNEVWVLDLATLNCEHIEIIGDFEARYEHSALLSADESAIIIFGGANTMENKNDLWELHLEDKKWTRISQDGDLPTPRTYHTTTAVVSGKKLLVFGGGANGPEAADDLNVYQLDIDSKKWSIVATKGQTPKPRQGHAVVAVDDKLFLHGGMEGEYLFDDLNILEGDGTWVSVDSCDSQPRARAAHGAVHYDRYIYIFGGLGDNRTALKDLWRLHTGTLVWEQIDTSGELPSGRLDCTMVVVNLPHTFIEAGDKDKAECVDQKPFILLHGGIDETGQIFDDFHVFSL